MRRSRFVAREFANTKRHDTYSPATGSHTNNLIPILYLQMLSQLETSGSQDAIHQIVLASLDIKDAFLQVPQEKVVVASCMTLHMWCCAIFQDRDWEQKLGTGTSATLQQKPSNAHGVPFNPA